MMVLKNLELKFDINNCKEMNNIYKSIRTTKDIMSLTKSFMTKYDEVVKKDISINKSYKMTVDDTNYTIRVTGWLQRIEIINEESNNKITISNVDKKNSSHLFKPVFILLYKSLYK